MQIKATLRFHLTPERKVITKETTNGGEDAEKGALTRLM
jgi:hypothetical protein